MPKCEDKVRIEYIDGKTWLLLEDFIYESDVEGIGTVVVPDGFITDFNSVPWFFWRVFPQTYYGQAAVVHDFLCRFETTDVRECGRKVTRKQADLVFKEFLSYLGAEWWRIRAMYIGVRIGAVYASVKR